MGENGNTNRHPESPLVKLLQQAEELICPNLVQYEGATRGFTFSESDKVMRFEHWSSNRT